MRHIHTSIFTYSIYSLKTFKEGKLWEVDFKAIRKFFVIFFSVSLLNSMGGVLCSAAVSEWLKMRKFLGIYYYQNAISGAEVNSNVINISKLWEVSTGFVILYYFLLQQYFFQSWKIEFSKNLGELQPPPPSPPPPPPHALVFTGLRYIYCWQSEGLSNERVNSITVPNYSFTPFLDYYGTKTRVEFNGNCLKHDKITYSHGK